MKRILVIIVLVILIVVGIFIYKKMDNKRQLHNMEGVYVVPTMENDIEDDSSYCSTFQLIWNDLKNDLVKTDIKFEEKNAFVDALNKESFKESDISSDMYYKVYGLKTLELKKEIEDAIWKKFKQKSDILDKFKWDEKSLDQGRVDFQRYFFYTMLYKEFSFTYAFDKLNDSYFNGVYDDIKYFGINASSDKKLYNQVEVLYYNSEDDFAIKLLTKENDEIIFNVNPKGNTFKEIYDNINKNASKYKDATFFRSGDSLRIPYLDFKLLKEYTELENKPFNDLTGNTYTILQALQSIQFEINEKGGKIKSEAGMDVWKVTSAINLNERNFMVNKTFAIFLKETNKDKPYFASKITDIKKFQQ